MRKTTYILAKKIHSRKVLVIEGVGKKIVFISRLFKGREHDYEILKRLFPKGIGWFVAKEVRVDLGFKGIEKDYKIGILKIPYKRKKIGKKTYGELSVAEKIYNREISKDRVSIEGRIGQLKNSRILHETIRLKNLSLLDKIVGVAAAIVNFKNHKLLDYQI